MSLNLLKQSLDILEQDSNHRPKTNVKNQTTRAKHLQKNENKTKNPKKIGDIKKEINQSKQKSKENLRKLLALSQNTLKNIDAEKIIKRAHKGRYGEVKPGKPKDEVESIFTEEDFRAFEEEYFAT